MIPHIFRIISLVAALCTFASFAYYVLCLWSAFAFLRERNSTGPAQSAQPLPAVSVLKPLKGTDPGMYESLRSHCLQDYPEYEIIFGLSDRNDPAAALAGKLKLEFPQRVRIVFREQALGANVKVSNLAQMVKHARHDCLVVSDSDIRVEPGYLRRVVAPHADSQVGLVTCLYRGIAGSTLGSRLESIGISTDFAAGVLAAKQLEGGLHFGLGSTLACRRSDLDAIGGFEALVDYLADDYEIGRRISGRGLRVQLSDEVVETHLPAYTLREFWRHQLRWARTIRDARRAGYAGLVLTFAIPWALLLLLASGGAPWAWGLSGLAVCARVLSAIVVGRVVLKDLRIFPALALLPVRDIIAVLVWIASFAGHTVDWRGDSFTLKDGRLVRSS